MKTDSRYLKEPIDHMAEIARPDTRSISSRWRLGRGSHTGRQGRYGAEGVRHLNIRVTPTFLKTRLASEKNELSTKAFDKSF